MVWLKPSASQKDFGIQRLLGSFLKSLLRPKCNKCCWYTHCEIEVMESLICAFFQTIRFYYGLNCWPQIKLSVPFLLFLVKSFKSVPVHGTKSSAFCNQLPDVRLCFGRKGGGYNLVFGMKMY